MNRGTILSFDSPKGLGVVEADDGVEYVFQCLTIRDDSREITPGERVLFEVRPGGPGQFEATSLLSLDS